MANAENIQKIITNISNEQYYFDMDYWYMPKEKEGKYEIPSNVCGTPACIGGWAEAIIGFERNLSNDDTIDLEDHTLADWMGISVKEADYLFYDYIGMMATRQEAINHLKHIAEGGEVNWNNFVNTNHED